MTTTAAQFHPPLPRWRALRIALPQALFLAVAPLATPKEFYMPFSSRLVFLTLLLTIALAAPATAFDFLGDIIATKPRKWITPQGTVLPENCPSGDYIYHVDSGDVVCRVDYGAPGQGAYIDLCTVDLFNRFAVNSEHCDGESQVTNTARLQSNVSNNVSVDRFLTEAPASEALEAMGFDGPLRLTGTTPTLDIHNTADFYLTGEALEHRIYRGGKAVVWHEHPNLGLVQLAAYDLVTLVVELDYATTASSIVVTAVRTGGLPIFPETWTGELTGPGNFVNGSVYGVFPARLGMELMEVGAVATPSLNRLSLLTISGLLAVVGWFGMRREQAVHF